MLEQIAAEMKARALANKLDFANNKVPTYEDSTKTLAVGDMMVKVMFTCDVFPGKEMWHLSMSVIPYGPVPDETTERVRKAFFGKSESFEMPSALHGNKMKQFVARA